MPAPTIYGTITLAAPSAPKPYAARHGNGEFIGFFETVRAAQVPIEQARGNRLLNWVRDDLAGAIESWRAEGT